MDFVAWINQMFTDWRGTSRKTVSEFARYVGVKQPVMSDWLNGRIKSPPSAESISKLLEKFGPGVYESLGLAVPGLSLENSNLLYSASKEINRAVKETGMDIEDPEFETLVTKIFEKYGVRAIRDD